MSFVKDCQGRQATGSEETQRDGAHKGDIRILQEVHKESANSAEVPDWRKVEACFDTGATDTVKPLRMCDHISVQTVS